MALKQSVNRRVRKRKDPLADDGILQIIQLCVRPKVQEKAADDQRVSRHTKRVRKISAAKGRTTKHQDQDQQAESQTTQNHTNLPNPHDQPRESTRHTTPKPRLILPKSIQLHHNEDPKTQTLCLDCQIPLQPPNHLLRLFPCRHIICDACFAKGVESNTPIHCSFCGACVHRPSPPLEGLECDHPIPFVTLSSSIPGDFFLREGQTTLGLQCQRCFVLSKMRQYTAEIREKTGLNVFACCGRGSDAIHGGSVSSLLVSELDVVVDELVSEAAFVTREFREAARGVGVDMALQSVEVVFRKANLEIGRGVGLGEGEGEGVGCMEDVRLESAEFEREHAEYWAV